MSTSAFYATASSYFTAAFAEGRFQEGETRKIELPEDDASVVGGLVQWLYFKSITPSAGDTPKAANDRFWQLAGLSTLADKYNIPALTNSIIDRLWDLIPEEQDFEMDVYAPRVPLISYVYENTSPSSPFRKLMVLWYVWEIDVKQYDGAKARVPFVGAHLDFIIDLAIALGQRLAFPERVNPFTLPSSMYYDEDGTGITQGQGQAVRL